MFKYLLQVYILLFKKYKYIVKKINVFTQS
jgi:hypothetical protein